MGPRLRGDDAGSTGARLSNVAKATPGASVFDGKRDGLQSAWPVLPDALNERDKGIGNQHEKKPGAKLGERHKRPGGGLAGVGPRMRESAEVFSEPDEGRHQGKTQQQWHRAMRLPDTVVNPGPAENEGRRNKKQKPDVGKIMVREEVH